MQLRHFAIHAWTDGHPREIKGLIGRLASDRRVADLLYARFDSSARGVASGDASWPGLLAVQRADPVGVCRWRQDEGIAFFGPVVVAEGKRRWGVGRALLERAVGEMRENGVRVVETAYPSACVACARLFAGCAFRPVGPESGPGDWTRAERILLKA